MYSCCATMGLVGHLHASLEYKAVRPTSLYPDKETESNKVKLNGRARLVTTGLCCFPGQAKNGGDRRLRIRS